MTSPSPSSTPTSSTGQTSSTAPTERTYRVPDVSCQHCVDAITGEVGPLEGVTSVEVDLAAKTVTVVGGDESAVVAAIDEAGYDIA